MAFPGGLSSSPRTAGRLLAAAALGLLAGCGPQVRHSAAAPINGAEVREARRADALGLTSTGVHSSQPARVNDIARALGEGAPEKPPPGEAEPPAGGDRRWYEGVLERHRLKIEDAWDDTGSGATFFQPFDDPKLRFVVVDKPVKIYNEQGRRFEDGANVYVSNRTTLRVASQLVVTAEPELGFVEGRDTDSDTLLGLQELAASARLGPVEFTAGRMPLWWGPGRNGALILSNNAQPLDMLRLSTAGPQLLPWIFSYLGLVQGEVFVSQLHDPGRVVPHPNLAGMRVSTRLNPYLELGASRTAMFGGKDRPVTLGTVGHVIAADTENSTSDPGDQRASLDARVIVPWKVQPFELYGELGGEDEAGGFFSNDAYLAGIYLPRIGPSLLTELTFEFVDTTVPGNPNVWYSNGNFPVDGYRYYGNIIGHHIGPDGLGCFTELRVHPGERVTVILSQNFEEHHRLDPVEEKLWQFRLGVEARVWRDLWLSAFGGVDAWDNYRQARGDRETGLVTGVGARLVF